MGDSWAVVVAPLAAREECRDSSLTSNKDPTPYASETAPQPAIQPKKTIQITIQSGLLVNKARATPISNDVNRRVPP